MSPRIEDAQIRLTMPGGIMLGTEGLDEVVGIGVRS